MHKRNYTPASFFGVSIIIILFLSGSSVLTGQNNQQADSANIAKDEVKAQPRFIKEEPKQENKLYSTTILGHGGMFQWTHSNGAVTIDPSLAIGGGVALNFRVIDFLEVSVGAGLSLQTTEATVQQYSATMPWIDNEGDAYEKRIEATDVKETQNYMWAEFPLLVRYFYTLSNWDLFAEAGAEYRMALKSTYDQEGVFSHHGYYEQYELLIDDLLSWGYYDNYEKSVEEADLEMNDLIMPFVGLGVVFPGQKSNFFFEARYYLSVSDPFNEKQDVLFSGPDNNTRAFSYQNMSVMNNGDVSFSGFRGSVGIRF